MERWPSYLLRLNEMAALPLCYGNAFPGHGFEHF